MVDEANHFTIADFENISIDSFKSRGLPCSYRNALKKNGISKIGDLKGKISNEITELVGEEIQKYLTEILCVIGIEYKLDLEYFREYPFMSQETEMITEMYSNQLKVPLSRIGLDIRIVRALHFGRDINKIEDLIGREWENVCKIKGIGKGRGMNLQEALGKYNVTIINGKFVIKSEIGEDQYGRSLSAQLEQFHMLAKKVLELPPEQIERVNGGIQRILKQYRMGEKEDV